MTSRPWYVDAFAGTGHRTEKEKPQDECLFGDNEAIEFQKGSATIALDTKPAFDHYIFIDKNPEYINELSNLKAGYQYADIKIVQDDCNQYLSNWCNEMDWRKNRAVAFLDPYGTQVDWQTMESIASTKAIDLWILFPLGQAVNRMLTRKLPDPTWAKRLDRFFGTPDWRNEFYRENTQMGLFDNENELEKSATFDSIGRYFVKRLESIFTKVAQKSLPLCNSKNIPIFLLCFASGSPKGATTAVKIANDILGAY
jgi:three-Cys-motif partner protein